VAESTTRGIMAATLEAAAGGADIGGFFAGRGVLVTGGTGFIGKVLVEKLLRSCPQVGAVYLLVRATPKETPQERVAALLASDTFDRVRAEQPGAAAKVVAVAGELTQEGLGLAPADVAALADTVSVVLHVAATIKFNERLQLAVQLNIVAVRRMLQFARGLKACAAVVHVSTAYSQTIRAVCDEVVYPPDVDVARFIDFVEHIDPALADALTPGFVGQRPNTYTFTKSLAEYVVATEGRGLPCCIVRPSIVFSAWREPYPGWTDNYNGPAGLSVAIGTGVLRVAPSHGATKADVVPVDGVVNFIIAAAWYSSRLYVRDPAVTTPVYNYTSSTRNPWTWGQWGDLVPLVFKKFPLERRIFRRPSVTFIPSTHPLYSLYVFFCHEIPARLSDFTLRLQGQKPRMVHTYAKLGRAIQEYEFFMNTEWTWTVDRQEEVRDALSLGDRETFLFDLAQMHWPSYIGSLASALGGLCERERVCVCPLP
jgi:fatty acyl-CoA reductase